MRETGATKLKMTGCSSETRKGSLPDRAVVRAQHAERQLGQGVFQ